MTIALSGGAILIALIIIWTWKDSAVKKARKEAAEFERRELGNRLMSAHYWFNGRPAYTANVLFMFAKRLQNDYGLNVDEVRRQADELGDRKYTELTSEQIRNL